jgi:hypothetical protein
VPFCAYNTLYRDGFLKLPVLADQSIRPSKIGLTLRS